jgi:branched-chain amino acid aminotransferase
MIKLQQPEWVYCRGAVRPWDEAVVHVDSDTVKRSVNVFEGLKGYWSHDVVTFGVVALERHFSRLKRSARLLHIPFSLEYRQFEEACGQLLERLLTPERDMWMRATLVLTDGHWGEGDESDLVLTAFHMEKRRPEPVNVGISTWRRASDLALPARIKTATNYQVARLARIEGRRHGFGEMILLNEQGRVAEASTCCLLMVRDGAVITTPASEGALESITVDIVEELCRSAGIAFLRRPVDRTELYVADELALAGTLAEIVPVASVDDHPLPTESPVLGALAEMFWGAVRNERPHTAVDLTVLVSRAAPATTHA